MYPKPKSAPARILQSKFVKHKTDAMKEIEAWVKKDDDPLISHEAIRVAGQLTDNVTEDRMLRAKLWELSRERYKFLSKTEYEKKIFEDRVKRKTASLQQRKLSASSTSGDNHARALEDHPDGDGRLAQKQRQNRRAAVSTRLDLFAEEHGKDEENTVSLQGRVWTKTIADPVRSQVEAADIHAESSVHAGAAAASEMLATLTAFGTPKPSSAATATRLLPVGGQVPGTQVPLNPRHARFNRRAYAAETDERDLEALTGRPANALPTDHRPASSVSSRGTDCPAPTMTHEWGSRDGTCRGRGVPPATKDPRYAQLENSLNPLRARRRQQDVTTIISSIASLHVPPVRAKKVKAKTEMKALEYMRERGFVF